MLAGCWLPRNRTATATQVRRNKQNNPRKSFRKSVNCVIYGRQANNKVNTSGEECVSFIMESSSWKAGQFVSHTLLQLRGQNEALLKTQHSSSCARKMLHLDKSSRLLYRQNLSSQNGIRLRALTSQSDQIKHPQLFPALQSCWEQTARARLEVKQEPDRIKHV